MKFLWSVLGVSMAFVAPCHAGWQFAEWGDTPEQVIAASGTQGVTAAPPLDSMPGAPRRLLGGHYSVGEFEFASWFYFGGLEQEGLSFVKLELADSDKCPSLQSEMETKYGDPSKTIELFETRSWVWLDRATNTMVAYTRKERSPRDPLASYYMCEVSYQQTITKRNSGL